MRACRISPARQRRHSGGAIAGGGGGGAGVVGAGEAGGDEFGGAGGFVDDNAGACPATLRRVCANTIVAGGVVGDARCAVARGLHTTRP